MPNRSAGGQTSTFLPPPQTQKAGQKAGVSRRKILRASAIAGGVVVVGGGTVVAGQQIIAHNQQGGQSAGGVATATQGTGGGQVHEYWVQADAFHHNLVPTGKDNMMGMKFKASDSSYWAVGYRAYTPNWGQLLPGSAALGPNTGIPGPIFRGAVGDTILVHFRNNDTHYHMPHSMHPHGVLYTPANDGAWIASDPQPGSMVAPGQSYTYEWHVRPNSVGTWIYHDHSVSRTVNGSMLMEFGAEVGLFGFLVLTGPSTKPVTREFFTFLHDLYQDDLPSLSQDYDCFNGFSYLGNTPTFQAKVGETVRWHIGALGKEFHAFHLHGHRWSSNGQFVDVVQLGPSNATSFEFVVDNPGKWLYHCHVTDHMMGGMMGMYEVTE